MSFVLWVIIAFVVKFFLSLIELANGGLAADVTDSEIKRSAYISLWT